MADHYRAQIMGAGIVGDQVRLDLEVEDLARREFGFAHVEVSEADLLHYLRKVILAEKAAQLETALQTKLF